jgi:hypothetical protein
LGFFDLFTEWKNGPDLGRWAGCSVGELMNGKICQVQVPEGDFVPPEGLIA